MKELIPLLLAAVPSGILGAWIAIAYQSKAERKRLVFEMLRMYLEMAPLRAHGTWVFEQCRSDPGCAALFPPQGADADTKRAIDHNYNKFLELGDWYEIVATLYRTQSLDNYLFDVTGLRSQVDAFRADVSGLPETHREHFQEFWPNLCQMK